MSKQLSPIDYERKYTLYLSIACGWWVLCALTNWFSMRFLIMTYANSNAQTTLVAKYTLMKDSFFIVIAFLGLALRYTKSPKAKGFTHALNYLLLLNIFTGTAVGIYGLRNLKTDS